MPTASARCTQMWQIAEGQQEHLRAPDELRNVVDAVCKLCQLLAARQAGSNVTETCQILAEDHGANEAIVTRSV